MRDELRALYKYTSSNASRLMSSGLVVDLVENAEIVLLRTHTKAPVINRGELRTIGVSDAYVRPGLYCAYRSDGQRVHETGYRSLLGDDSREPALDLSGRAELPHRKITRALFGGVWYAGHFGHFLTESISRLWAAITEHETSAETIVFIEPTNSSEIELATRVRRFLERHFELVFVKGKVQVDSLIVPDRTFLGNSFAHPRHKDVAEHIWSAVSEGDMVPSRYSGGDVYLSRSKLHPSLRRIVNELPLERALASRGFTVLHPQSLTLADQVAVFRDARTICGFIGSAFHTMLLAPSPAIPNVIMVTAGAINLNYVNIDSICRKKSTYLLGARPYRLSPKLGSNDRDIIAERHSIVKFLETL